MPDVKLTKNEADSMYSSEAYRLATSLEAMVMTTTAQLANLKKDLASAKVNLRAAQVAVLASHGVTAAPSATITRAVRPDGEYLVVS